MSRDFASSWIILRSTPPQNDDIAETVNYGAVVRILRHLCRSSEYHLLETLAEAIAGAFFVYEEVIATRIQILKPDRYPDLKGIGIELGKKGEIDDSDSCDGLRCNPEETSLVSSYNSMRTASTASFFVGLGLAVEAVRIEL